VQTLGQPAREATDLYRLAYLLTGDSATGLDVAIEAIEDNDNAFFSHWMLAWSRRVVIAKSIVAIRAELTASIPASRKPLPPPGSNLRLHTSADLDRALLGIDTFPRCALLLSVFERVSLADAAILLDCTPAAVEHARNIGLRELTANLAPRQELPSTAACPFWITGDLQRA
jgi:DNA-directed RNA polymerase specialized sigma24 family protein